MADRSLNRRGRIGLSVGAAILVVVISVAGYALGRAGAPDEDDAFRDREDARQQALSRGELVRKEAVRRARAKGRARGRRRGRREGTAAGTSAGRQAVASGGNGPTVLPPPKLASNLTVVPAEEFAERPASITVGNHSVLEGIAWSTWGEATAAGSGTLLGVECEPSCAEGPETRKAAQLEASEPQFSPDNVRYYSRLRVTPTNGRAFTVEVRGF